MIKKTIEQSESQRSGRSVAPSTFPRPNQISNPDEIPKAVSSRRKRKRFDAGAATATDLFK
jgi:hypothetical protein